MHLNQEWGLQAVVALLVMVIVDVIVSAVARVLVAVIPNAAVIPKASNEDGGLR
jgi:hypothetical protein